MTLQINCGPTCHDLLDHQRPVDHKLCLQSLGSGFSYAVNNSKNKKKKVQKISTLESYYHYQYIGLTSLVQFYNYTSKNDSHLDKALDFKVFPGTREKDLQDGISDLFSLSLMRSQSLPVRAMPPVLSLNSHNVKQHIAPGICIFKMNRETECFLGNVISTLIC